MNTNVLFQILFAPRESGPISAPRLSLLTSLNSLKRLLYHNILLIYKPFIFAGKNVNCTLVKCEMARISSKTGRDPHAPNALSKILSFRKMSFLLGEISLQAMEV